MKKSDQVVINNMVLAEIKNVNEDLEKYPIKWERLRYCSAEVATTPRYYILRSYNTIVAVIDRNSDTLFDFLRWIYGYTSTSAQHISKFNHDYGSGYYGAKQRYVYRNI